MSEEELATRCNEVFRIYKALILSGFTAEQAFELAKILLGASL